MSKLGIIYNPRNDGAVSEAEHVKQFAIEHGIEVWSESSWNSDQFDSKMHGTDIVITAGGDGTVLRAAQKTCLYNIPIAGINHGTLGFLTEIPQNKVDESLLKIFQNDYSIDERNVLEVDVTQPNQNTVTYHALNDIVVARAEMARLVGINAEIDGHKLTYFKADGVICCSATGSTGYAYACGGSVMYPSSKDIQLVAIGPHLTFEHPVIIPENSKIKLTLYASYNGTLNMDGHINIPILDKTEFNIRKSNLKVHFIRLSDTNFYETLTTKLRTRL